MLKYIIGFVIYLILAFIYSACVVSHRCDEEEINKE